MAAVQKAREARAEALNSSRNITHVDVGSGGAAAADGSSSTESKGSEAEAAVNKQISDKLSLTLATVGPSVTAAAVSGNAQFC